MEKHRRNISTLEAEFKKLKVLRKILEKEKIDTENQLRRVQYRGPTSEAKVIAFVKAIERAKKYHEFKGYLKQEGFMTHDSVVLEVFENLVKDQKARESFKELEFQDIMDAVDENIADLQIEQARKYCELQGEAFGGWILNPSIDLSYRIHEKETSGGRISNPFIDLSYRIHEKGYVMDQDPLVELSIIEKNHPVFYIKRFMGSLEVKYSEKKVMVHNIPMGYDEDKLRASFSGCGDIEHVKMESRYGRVNNVAQVTFCSAEGAKLAPFLKKNVRFIVLPSPEPQERQAETSTESTEYIRARSKYSEFRDLAKQLSKQIRRRRQRLKKKTLQAGVKPYACDGSNICSEDQPIPKMPNSNIS